ncbi:hypothetical protein [Candidatus Nitrososphaera sp. FF02]|uniref:hypothetical protein n=1 Tax=Candidatus Nitrososphaera sp. FF02 TaxID=3398226 RepID=UPI0039E8214A
MPDTVDNFCEGILALDRKIRFAGVAGSRGRLLGYAYRKGLAALLTKEESEISVLQSFVRMDSRATLERKLRQDGVRVRVVRESKEGDDTDKGRVQDNACLYDVV